jgi:hypothetical protein
MEIISQRLEMTYLKWRNISAFSYKLLDERGNTFAHLIVFTFEGDKI